MTRFEKWVFRIGLGGGFLLLAFLFLAEALDIHRCVGDRVEIIHSIPLNESEWISLGTPAIEAEISERSIRDAVADERALFPFVSVGKSTEERVLQAKNRYILVKAPRERIREVFGALGTRERISLHLAVLNRLASLQGCAFSMMLEFYAHMSVFATDSRDLLGVLIPVRWGIYLILGSLVFRALVARREKKFGP